MPGSAQEAVDPVGVCPSARPLGYGGHLMSLVGPQLEQCAPMARSGHRHCLTSLVMRCGVWVALLLVGACAADDPALPGDGGQVVETPAGTGSVALTEPTQPDAAPAETAPAEAPDGGRDAGNRAPSSAQAPSTTGPLSADRPESESPAHSGSAPDCAGQRAKWPAAPSSGTTPPAEPWNGPAVFDLERAVNDTTRAVELVSQPGTGRLFVVGRDGIISEARDGAPVEPAFLDIEAEVLSQADAADEDSAPPPGAGVESLSSEQGLLSLAFHPDHEANELLYTFHTRFGDGASVVTEWRVRSGGDVDTGSARTVIVFEQDPAEPTHKGGQLRFGPDGYLYIAVGDGGASGDLYCHGRNRHTPLGAIVRIDPVPSPTGPYTIPADNPYADGASGHPALWASGLRNPWRFTIDGDLLIIADVGWNDREEINSARISTDAGIDFGWSAFEGEVCIRADYCDEPGAPPGGALQPRRRGRRDRRPCVPGLGDPRTGRPLPIRRLHWRMAEVGHLRPRRPGHRTHRLDRPAVRARDPPGRLRVRGRRRGRVVRGDGLGPARLQARPAG